ncbi:hypothetical protein LTR95_009711, partial [Oleoguttula sp. CCFEE 5521]
MARTTLSTPLLVGITVITLILLARPANAFGAGNIASTAKIEGQNWRHGDIEDTLLTLLTAHVMGGKKFSKLDVKRVYFGNWLRDYSQAVDVGTVKYVSAEAIRLLLWVLGFMSFGYGTAEFEVTKERLGCYRPEEHIDNPKDYADNLDARQYDRRLRGPVDERRELGIDENTGLKNYISSEQLGITTSAGLIRSLFGKAIELGRRYRQSRDDRDFFEALRLLGTGCHCLEDFSAHSNYTELALIELGERDVFPHVGRRTQIQLRGARQSVFPIITGTFGGVDFLHSVMGELTDKATQSEIQELEGTITQAQNQDTSILKDLLSKVPPGIFGDEDEASKADELQANATAAQMQNLHVSPKDPEAFTQQVDEITKQIYPIIEWHDNLMKNITKTIDAIPILPELLEQLQEQISIFVFSLIAPFVLPIITQVKNELKTGSSEIIQSSKDAQLRVFNDDNDTNPTHSMLSKDHFSNVLNEPAGKIASQVLKWVVPQIVACWDDDRIDIGRTINRIITGVFHHPALREYGDDGARDGRMQMFQVVEQWWGQMDRREQDDMRRKLSRDGVLNGRNHKEGVHDSGHGCGKPLGLPNYGYHGLGQALGGGNQSGSGGRPGMQSQISDSISQVAGGGALGGILGGVAGAVGAGLLGGAFGDENKTNKQTYQSTSYSQDGSRTSRVTETAHRYGDSSGQEERYGQASVSSTQYSSGGGRESYQRYEQDGRSGNTGYGFQQTTETRPTQSGGYEQRTERKYERPGGEWNSEVQSQRISSDGRQQQHSEDRYSSSKKQDSDDDDDDDDDDWEKKEKKRRKKEEKRLKKQREEEEERGGGSSYGRQKSRSRERKHSDEHKRRSGGYGGGESRNEYSGRENQSSRRDDDYPAQGARYGESQQYGGGSGYGQQQQSEYGRSERTEQSDYGRSDRDEQPSYGRSERNEYEQPSSGYDGDHSEQRSEYGREQRESSYGQSSGYGQQQDSSYGQSGGYGGSGSGERMPGGFGDDEEVPERRGGGYGGDENQYGGGG